VNMLCLAVENGNQYEIRFHSGVHEPRRYPDEAQTVSHS